MASSKFKKALAEVKSATTTPPRAAIPQVDPGEAAQSVPVQQPNPVPATPSPVATTQAPKPTSTPFTTALPAGDRTQAVRVDPRALPVDTTVRVIPFGSHLYPDRHKQVLYEAFMLDVKPWEVIETALAEYFERRYGATRGQH